MTTNFDSIALNVNDGLTALAGGGQTGATLLKPGINVVATVATAADSCLLPAGLISSGNNLKGASVEVTNLGANSTTIYPQLGGAINTGAANAGFALAAGKSVRFNLLRTSGQGGYTADLWATNLSA